MNGDSALPSVSIVGAGNVGSACAEAIVCHGLAHVKLLDLLEDRAEGRAMDISHATAAFHSPCRVWAPRNLSELCGSDVVIVTAGAPRRWGMERADLLAENWAVLSGYCKQVQRHCPQTLLLVVSNPVDGLTALARRQYPQLNVVGLGCALDTLRLCYYLSRAAEVAVTEVEGLVIGDHSPSMIPLIRQARIGCQPARAVLSEQQIDRVCWDTRHAGDVILGKVGRGSWFAAGVLLAEIVRAVVTDSGRVFSLDVGAGGIYDLGDATVSLPVRVGAQGVREVLAPDLDEQETAALQKAAQDVENLVQQIHARMAAL